MGMRALPNIYAHLEGRRAEGMGICRQIPSAHVISDIKTHGSESRGQEEAACMRVFGPRDHYSEYLHGWQL